MTAPAGAALSAAPPAKGLPSTAKSPSAVETRAVSGSALARDLGLGRRKECRPPARGSDLFIGSERRDEKLQGRRHARHHQLQSRHLQGPDQEGHDHQHDHHRPGRPNAPGAGLEELVIHVIGQDRGFPMAVGHGEDDVEHLQHQEGDRGPDHHDGAGDLRHLDAEDDLERGTPAYGGRQPWVSNAIQSSCAISVSRNAIRPRAARVSRP